MSRAPPRTTSIEHFLDLETIMSSNALASTGRDSTEGYPPMPNVNSNFTEQMQIENYEREKSMRPIQQSRIRSTDPNRLAIAMNGGREPIHESFELGPVARQNLQARVQENYEEPTPSIKYAQHASLPQNSALYSHYSSPVTEEYLNCMDVARHIQRCPLCSKFYDNDRSMYWAAIVVLLLACGYLLKRVLDAKKLV